MGWAAMSEDSETVETTERTRTVEREEVSVETVEEQEFGCPVCEQWYDRGEMVPVGLGVDEDGDIPHHRAYLDEDQLCESCAESLFDYDGPSGLFDYLATEWEHIGYRELLSGAASIAIPLGTGAAFLYGLGFLLRSVGSLTPDASTEQAVTNPFLTEALGAFGPLIFIPVLIFALSQMLRLLRGPM